MVIQQALVPPFQIRSFNISYPWSMFPISPNLIAHITSVFSISHPRTNQTDIAALSTTHNSLSTPSNSAKRNLLHRNQIGPEAALSFGAVQCVQTTSKLTPSIVYNDPFDYRHKRIVECEQSQRFKNTELPVRFIQPSIRVLAIMGILHGRSSLELTILLETHLHRIVHPLFKKNHLSPAQYHRSNGL